MTHSLLLRLLCWSCFSQLQSQVILNNSPAALAHSNAIRALTSLTILLHIAFQTVNAFLPLGPPLPAGPGAQDVYSSTWTHHCVPMATTALVFTLSPTTDSRDPGRFGQEQLPWHCASLFWKCGDVLGHDGGGTAVVAGTGHHTGCSRQWDKYGVESTTIKQHILFPAQTIFSQIVKSLFLAAAVLFLDLVPMVLTVWSHIYFTGSFKEISGRVAGTSCPLRRMDCVSFCRAIALKLVPMKVWRFFSGPRLVGENPISPWRTHISLGRSLLSLQMIK